MWRAAMSCAVVLASLASPGASQIPFDAGAGSAVLTRDDLTRLLALYEDALRSPAYSATTKEAARSSAARIRDRLDQGDFRVGDRVVLDIQGETQIPDTVSVEPGPKITLPLFGEIPLAGVLRSEITDHLTRELGRVLRDPVVRAEGLMRLSIQGSVTRPGFYVVPTDMLIGEALMFAGGPAGEYDLQGLRIERGTTTVLGSADMQEALIQGRTLDQLNLQAGDQLFLPTVQASAWSGVGRYALIIATSIVFGVRVF